MLGMKRMIKYTADGSYGRGALLLFHYQQQLLTCHQDRVCDPLPPQLHSRKTSIRFLDIYQLGSKAAIEKERARLTDEMNRGYFADVKEFNEHGGKIAMASKIIIPEMVAVKFPDLEANHSDGRVLKLPIRSNSNVAIAETSVIPKATLICLSFRASSQKMIDSWTVPFLDTFCNTEDIQLYEVSLIDSWFLCRKPIKWLLLRAMKKSVSEGSNSLQKQIVYSFGDHYYFRKELKILNLLTGYIFLLDKFGRIRWQGYGMATKEELSSLLSSSTFLLEQK